MNRSFFNDAQLSIYFSLTAFSVVLIHLSLRPIRDALQILGVSVFLATLQFAILRVPVRVVAELTLVGLSSFLLLGLRALWTKTPEQKLLAVAFVTSGLFVFSEYFASSMLDFTARMHPKTFDLFLNWFDCTLRIQLSFAMGRLYSKYLWFRALGLLFYVALPIPLGWVYARQLRRVGTKAISVMIAFLITGPIGIIIYNLLPACGPIHLFGSRFPSTPLPIDVVRSMQLVTLPVIGPRNAIPSLHMTWVLLAWWLSAGLSRTSRAFVFISLVFTVFATLGTGEHYFIDLVVAFPHALMIVGICMLGVPLRHPRRSIPLLAGTLMTLGWIGLLSLAPGFLWISPLIPWALVSLTIIVSVALERRSCATAACSVLATHPTVDEVPESA